MRIWFLGDNIWAALTGHYLQNFSTLFVNLTYYLWNLFLCNRFLSFCYNCVFN